MLPPSTSVPPVLLHDVEITAPLAALAVDPAVLAVRVLVRLHGEPVGEVTVRPAEGRYSADALAGAIADACGDALARRAAGNWLAATPAARGPLRWPEVLAHRPPAPRGPLPSVTVAVCTRGRPDDLALCLDALTRVDYPGVDLLVVDNAAPDDRTERLVRERYPQVRYAAEPRPGLDWARTRAVRECRGEILAYTDDDVVVERGWLRALAAVFVECPEADAVTGAVLPYELRTEAQQRFEAYGGFGKGFERRWTRRARGARGVAHHGAGQFGTGANMAFRRALFDRVGGWDPALDVGTAANGGGDLELFFRVIQEGGTLVYEPRALVRHRHRADAGGLVHQIDGWGTGVVAYMLRSARAYPSERGAFARLWWRWAVKDRLPRLAKFVLRRDQRMAPLARAELRGLLLRGVGAARAARRQAAAARANFGPIDGVPPADRQAVTVRPNAAPWRPGAVAVRTVDLDAPIVEVDDVRAYDRVRLYFLRDRAPIAWAEVDSAGAPVRAAQVRDAAAGVLARELMGKPADPWTIPRSEAPVTPERRALAAYLARAAGAPPPDAPPAPMPPTTVSVVIATRDRPDDLRECLRQLAAQRTRHRVQVVVVDNHPASGLTRPVVAAHPEVLLVEEPRPGLSYARNAGIVASTGAIVVATDDDVRLPPEWLDRLVEPFARAEVMGVTGNVLPLELETRSQQFFERYGGLGRGFARREVGREWFAGFGIAVPTWALGATANAAFRAAAFRHPDIGLLDETLGAGMPAGVGEDTLLFYRTLRAGYTMVYEPRAYVWHRHRATMRGLRKQLFDYSAGGIAYQLTTLRVHGDRRALRHLTRSLPKFVVQRLVRILRGRDDYPLSLALLELWGQLLGPLAYWRSHRRVRRLGRSAPFVRGDERASLAAPPSDASEDVPAARDVQTTGTAA